MLATVSIGRLICVYNGKKWECEDDRLTRQLNEFTRQFKLYELGPESGDPVLAVTHAVVDMFNAQIVTLPPPEPLEPGQTAQ